MLPVKEGTVTGNVWELPSVVATILTCLKDVKASVTIKQII